MIKIVAESLMVRLRSHGLEVSGASVEMDALPWVVLVVVVGLVVAYALHRGRAEPAASTRKRNQTP